MKMYKDYGIDFNVYGRQEYSVQYCGDDFVFGTEKEAEQFIDEVDSKMKTSFRMRCFVTSVRPIKNTNCGGLRYEVTFYRDSYLPDKAKTAQNSKIGYLCDTKGEGKYKTFEAHMTKTCNIVLDDVFEDYESEDK